MSKEVETVELSAAIIEVANNESSKLDDYSLALVGGGEIAIAV